MVYQNAKAFRIYFFAKVSKDKRRIILVNKVLKYYLSFQVAFKPIASKFEKIDIIIKFVKHYA